jgi:hypothetical protein
MSILEGRAWRWISWDEWPQIIEDSANPTLTLNLTVKVQRVGRRRCPCCGNVRVLFRLIAFAQSAVGDGPMACGACGGLYPSSQRD